MNSARNRRILVVDDTPTIHEDFQKILGGFPGLASMSSDLFGDAVSASDCHFELSCAYQGKEGLELVRAAVAAAKPFSMAFVDVRMPPGWDGVETVSRIWQLDPEIQIVICTAHSDYSWREISEKLGRPEQLLILKKPFDVIEVVQLAHTLTEKWHLRKESQANQQLLEESVQRRTEELRAANQELSRLAAERQTAAERIEQLNRLYLCLCKINAVIVRSTCMDSLCQEACRILTQDGLFVMAWFGVPDASSLSIRPVAWAGKECGYILDLQVTTNPGALHSVGPCGTAVIEGRISICNNTATDPSFAAWRERAIERGYASVAAFPLKNGPSTVGMLALYSGKVNFFKAQEIELLERLSEDLSFAIGSFERATQLRLQSAALMAAENSIVITDLDSVILWHNPAFSILTGFSAAESLGRKMSLLKSGKHSPDFYHKLWQTIRSGRPWDGEIINRRKDGQIFTNETTITPVQTPDGNITHFIAIQRDVTARINSERRTEQFAKLGKNLNIASTSREAAQIIVEVADVLLAWDACLFQLYSASERLLSDVLVMDVVAGRRSECQSDPTPRCPTGLALKAIEQGAILVARDNPEAMRPDGTPFGDTTRPSASILFVPIRNGKDTIGVLSIQSYASQAYDQSSLNTLQALADHCGGALDRIRTEEKLRETQEQLRQSQKLEGIGQLASGVAHDFNNLLAVIRGNADLILLKPDQITPEIGQCLQQVTAATDRAANLTRQLLIFSRKQVMRTHRVDLNLIVTNLTKMLRRVIGEHIDFQCQQAPEPCFVNADSTMLDQVIVNLAVNARDAMPSGGRLIVTTEHIEIAPRSKLTHPESRPGSFVSLSVRDSGSGISPDVLPRIFEPFFTTKAVGKGTGLGLSTVYGIVKQHEGWIELFTRLGTGSVFTIFLPVAQETAPGGDSEKQDDDCLRSGNEKILLVEDEDRVRALTRRILERFGYQVQEAPSAAEVRESYCDRPLEVDLLLTDIIMPGGLRGEELAKFLRVRNPSLKVLFTSGYSGDALRQETDFSREHFVAKPCSVRQLLTAVRKCLDGKGPDQP
jgi:two-component system, cell cycle sensor histidine kinase and response regulator CckA